MKKFNKLYDLAGKLEDELDFDFRAQSQRIDSFQEFYENIIVPYAHGDRIYFRGERIRSIDRPLLPSIFRHRNIVLDDDENFAQLDAQRLLYFYNKYPEYTDVFKKTIGGLSEDNLYPFLSFSQHYFGLSPLIDLTKNPFVSLSFALKNRTEYDEDILFYTVEIKDENDYTTHSHIANEWMKNYNVIVLREAPTNATDALKEYSKESLLKRKEYGKENLIKYKDLIEEIKGRSIFEISAPMAKLIDVPTNDLMRFQQGVFLLLDDFTIFGNGYLTKKIRDDFAIKKWIINKDICPELLDYQKQKAPYYDYDTITDLSKAVGKIKKNYF
ncbi:FRG domain-containing protein [Eubacterium coprostanoligenes]|uniref:FRG domain-containing protein n=1 Tax=Eubacterium coprostanoligenes TaxID=290054 RepID=UPI002357B9C3|nr:FRG domain-containing protein [Eubacterium coprostanoligenes]MCI6254544.1 FRG domain-containing protein [Eubacterium coprostanoligenes]MDY5400730.1 FRG domain-containing protein [Eubacterium coprostanoligenes]